MSDAEYVSRTFEISARARFAAVDRASSVFLMPETSPTPKIEPFSTRVPRFTHSGAFGLVVIARPRGVELLQLAKPAVSTTVMSMRRGCMTLEALDDLRALARTICPLCRRARRRH